MSALRNKMVATSRFKLQVDNSNEEFNERTSRKILILKTQQNEVKMLQPINNSLTKNKPVTNTQIKGVSLQKLIKKSQQKRIMCLKSISQRTYQPISRVNPFDIPLRLSRHQKQNIKSIIRNTISQTPRKKTKMTDMNEKLIRTSFNRIIREIKQRNFIRRDDQNQVLKSRAQAYAASIKGQKHSLNQDSLIFSQGIYIICDGHGTNGKQISQFISVTAHKFFQQAMHEHKIDNNSIKHILKKIQIQLDLSGIDIAFSGCTFITLLLYQNTLYSINVGDSRAVICQGLIINQLCVLHKPDHPLERQRIQECGGIIHPIQIGKDKFAGPNRIWAPGRNSWGPGLALSRAFGDKAARKYGVISQGDIKTFHLTYEDDFVVMGSDGLFDYMKDSDISFFIRKKLKDELTSRQDLALSLVQQAKRLSGQQSDDISCIIILL